MFRKWMIVLAVLLVCTVLVIPQLAADVHFFFSKELDSLTLNPLEGWAAVLGGGLPLRFYLLFTASVALFLVWFVTNENSLNYKDKLQRITPNIATPLPAGQGQFGTARWSGEAEQRRIFTVWSMNRRSPELRTLLQAGMDDRKEIQNADIPID